MPFAELLGTYIGAGLGALLLILGIAQLLSPRVRQWFGFLPGTPMVWAWVFILVGFVAGGGAYIAAYANPATAAVTNFGVEKNTPILAESMLESCIYSAADEHSNGIAIRQDPNSANTVILDLDEYDWNVTTNVAVDFNVSFSCTRAGSDVHEDGAVDIVVKGDEFKSPTTTTDSAVYNVLEVASRPSLAFPGKYQQTVYVADGAYATTASPVEMNTLTFTEGVKRRTLGIQGEIDLSGFIELQNYTTKDITIYQKTSAGQTPVAVIRVNKIP